MENISDKLKESYEEYDFNYNNQIGQDEYIKLTTSVVKETDESKINDATFSTERICKNDEPLSSLKKTNCNS